MTLLQEWGNAAWFLFHSLCEKMKDEYDCEENIVNLRTILVNICNNLPCPICAEHVTIKLNQINLNEINTKDKLRKTFYYLHNSVNNDLGKEQFNENDLYNKYSCANTLQIVNYFIQMFRKMNQGNFKMLFVRNNTLASVDQFINYLNHNAYLFNE